MSDSYVQDLHLRQQEHVQCLVNAKKVGLDINETCATTAWKAAEAYLDWARYRAPFKTPESEAQLKELTDKMAEAKKN